MSHVFDGCRRGTGVQGAKLRVGSLPLSAAWVEQSLSAIAVETITIDDPRNQRSKMTRGEG